MYKISVKIDTTVQGGPFVPVFIILDKDTFDTYEEAVAYMKEKAPSYVEGIDYSIDAV